MYALYECGRPCAHPVVYVHVHTYGHKMVQSGQTLLEDNEYLGNTDRALDGRPPGTVTDALVVVGSMFGSVEMSALKP
jgi:hypothetical protein